MPKSANRGTVIRDVRVRYLEHLGPAVAVTITIPEGTRAVQVVDGLGAASWAVDDTALLIRLTGNAHDPQYRHCMLPADAVLPVV